jgi:Zn-dependent alcohol dehydrogenase
MAAKVRGVKTIIGVDRKQSRLDLARQLGATHIVDTSRMSSLTMDLTTAIKEIVPAGTNANFDTTGAVPIIDAGVKTLHHKGQMVLIGVVDGTLAVELGPMLAVSFLSRA